MGAMTGAKEPQKKRTKDPNAPKKPLTPFFIFLKKRRMELAGSETLLKNVTGFTTMIGKEWNEMSAEQKLMYKHDAELGKAVLAKAEAMGSTEATPNSLTVTNQKPAKPSAPQQQPQARQQPSQ